MRKYKGSFTVEASFILPLILLCICVVIELGITLHQEVRMQVAEKAKEETMDMIDAMYHREYLKELLGAFYED